jgi:hypothetical protein
LEGTCSESFQENRFQSFPLRRPGREGEKRRKNLYSWIHSIDFFSSLIPVKQEIRL